MTDSALIEECLTLLRAMSARRDVLGQRMSTQWIAISGPPLSGKTTLVESLKAKGFAVVTDKAREVIEVEVMAGKSKQAARAKYFELQDVILGAMLDAADLADAQALTFFDFALPDNIAFIVANNYQSPLQHLLGATAFRYKHCFLCVPLPGEITVDDPVRVESKAQRQRIFDLMEKIYGALNISVTILEVVETEKRVELVLDWLVSNGLRTGAATS